MMFIITFGFLFWKDIIHMVTVWYTDPNYSHGFLIPVISGYILYSKKEQLKHICIDPSKWGLGIFFAGLGLYLIAKLAGEFFTLKVSMLIVLAGAIIFSCGSEFFKSISFPFFYLIFMIPLPYILYDSIAFPLKLIVSRLSVSVLENIGIFALREGNIIHLEGITLEVADACSGIRSIISLLAVSTALSYFSQRKILNKIILITLAIPIAITVNSLRVILTGVLANYYGVSVAEGFFHEFAGLFIFGLAIILIIVSAIILRRI